MERREPLDTFDRRPTEMVAYLRHYGWHFNKRLCMWAVSRMYKKDSNSGKPEPIEPWSKEQVDELLKSNNILLNNNVGWDYIYVANMAKADFFESSLQTEESVAKFIKDYIDDLDQVDGFVMNRFYADCVRAGYPIPWDEMI